MLLLTGQSLTGRWLSMDNQKVADFPMLTRPEVQQFSRELQKLIGRYTDELCPIEMMGVIELAKQRYLES